MKNENYSLKTTSHYMLSVLSVFFFLLSMSIPAHATVLISPTGDGGFSNGSTFPSNGWTLANSPTGLNKWFIGATPTGLPSGYTGNVAYISSDPAGANNNYDVGSSSLSHFYRDVTLPAGESTVYLTFDWSGFGESSWDEIIVSVAPTSVTPAGGGHPGSGFTVNGISNSVVVGFFQLSTTRQKGTVVIPQSVLASLGLSNCSSSTTIRLIFSWKSDTSVGSNPGGAVDNISLVSSLPPAQSSGPFTINNTLATGGTNFSSISEAISYLNNITSCGGSISSPMVFNVSAGQTFFEDPPALLAQGSAVNTITFQKSGAGNNPIVVPFGTGNTLDFGLCLSGADFVTFDGIDVNASSTILVEFGYLVRNNSATNGAFNNTVKNCTIAVNRTVTTTRGILQAQSSAGGGFTASGIGGVNSNNQYLNLSIKNTYVGIYLLGGTSFIDQNNTVGTTACSIFNSIGDPNVTNDIGGTSTQTWGIRAFAQQDVKIFNNNIQNVTHTSTSITAGIWIDNSGSSTYTLNGVDVYNNIVHGIRKITSTGSGVTAGIIVNTTSPTAASPITARIYNNLVYDIQSTSTTTTSRMIIGIFAQQAGSSNVNATQNYDHNTVNISAGNLSSVSSCFEIGTSSGPVINCRSNNLTNFTANQTGSAKHYAIVTTSASQFGNTGSLSNFNNFYVPNATNGFTGLANTTDRPTLAGATNPWNLITNGGSGQVDLNSLAIDPLYFNAASGDFHVISGGLDQTGSSADSWNTTDLGCQSRASLTPSDIGVYAYIPPPVDLAAFALIAPNSGSCHGAAETATVRIKNFSASAIDFSLNPATVSVTLSGAGSGSASTTLSTGTLAPGSTQDVVVGTVNTAASGAYVFTSSVSVTGDAVASNNSRTDNLSIAAFSVSITGPASGAICLNNSTTLTAVPANQSNPVSYVWSPATGLSSTTTTSVTASPTGTTTYTVNATDNCTNTSSATFALTVNPLPNTTVTPGTGLICGTEAGLRDPASLTLTASGANTFSWSPSTGLNTTTGATVVAIPTSTTTYVVTGTNTTTGCIKTASAVITVGPKVLVSATAVPSDVCAGGTSQLNAVANQAQTTYAVSSIAYGPVADPGTGTTLTSGDDAVSGTVTIPFNFNFYGATFNTLVVYTNGFIQLGPSSGSTTTYGQLLPSTSTPNNIIAGVFSDLNLPTVDATHAIRGYVSGVSPNRIVTIHYQNVSFYDFNFGNSASGNIDYYIQLFEGTNVIEVHVADVTGQSTTTTGKTLGVENNAGTAAVTPVNRNFVSWNVAPASPEAWRFTPTVAGPVISPAPTFSWTPSTFLSNTAISNPVANSVNATVNYTVTATTPSGCAGSAQVQLNSGTLVANITSNDNVSCAGQQVVLSANITSGAGPYTYTWFPGGQTTQSITVAPTSTTTYSVVVNGPCPGGGATTSATFTQTVEPVPVLNLNTGYSVLCFGSVTPATLTASGNGTAYAWSPSTGLDATSGATVHASGLANSITYTVVSTLGNCTSSATTRVRVPGPIHTYATATPPAVCVNGVSLLEVAPQTTGSYFATSETPAPIPTPGSGVTTLSNSTPVAVGDFDEGYWPVALPFRFGLFDEGYSTAYINTDGYVNFTGAPITFTRDMIPSASSPNASVFLAWRDWNLTSSGSIQYFTVGSAPNRVFVVKYVNVPPFSGTGTLNGQIELYENGDVVLFLNTTDGSTVKSLGIEGADGVHFSSFSSRNGIPWTISSPEMWKFTAQSGSFNYSWSPASQVFDASAASTSTNPLSSLPVTFTVTVMDTSGCSNSSSATVIEGIGMVVNILPSVNDTICFGTPLTLTAQVLGGGPPYTFTWDDGTNIIAGPGNFPTISVNPAVGDAEYNVTVTDQCNPVPGLGDISIHVNALPTLSVLATPAMPGGGGVACGSDSATLVASGSSLSYQWSPAAGLNQATGNTVKAQPSVFGVTTNYTVTGTDANGCTNSIVKPVKHAFSVSNIVSATPSNICSGSSSQLTSLSTLQANNYVVSSLDYADRVTTPVSNPGPSGDEGNTTASIGFNFNFYGNSFSQVTIHTNGQVLLGGNRFEADFQYEPQSTHSTIPSSDDPNNWIGFWGDMNISPGEITYGTVGIAPNRKFIVRWTNATWWNYGGSPPNGLTYQVELNETTNIIDIFINTLTGGVNFDDYQRLLAVENSDGSLGVTPPGRSTGFWDVPSGGEGWRIQFPTAGLSYAWTPTTFLNNPTISNPLASGVSATTDYTATVTSSDGCIAQAHALVKVQPLVVDSLRSNSANVCQDSSLTITAYVSGGGTPYTYSWTDNGNAVGTNSATLTVTGSTTGNHTYAVSVTDICGSPAATNSIVINTVARPPVAVTTSGDICGSGTATLTATGANTYTWSPSGSLSSSTGSSVTAAPAFATLYNVVGVSTATGCGATAAVMQWVHVRPTSTVSATPNPILLNANSQLGSTVSQISNYGYTVAPLPYSDRNVSSLTNSGPTGDEGNTSAALGFTFPFSGNTYNAVTIHTNGQVAMGAGVTDFGSFYPVTAHTTFPNAATVNNWIGFWGDMNISAGQIMWDVVGLAPNRKFIARWTNASWFSNVGQNSLNFQVELNETTGYMDVFIGALSGGTVGDVVSSRMIAMENIDGTYGVTAPGREAGYWNVAAGGEGWRFAPITIGAPVFQYAWSPSTYLNATNIPNPLASSVGGVITYTLNVTNLTTGCSALPATIQVLAGVPLAVNITSPSGLNAICAGQSLALGSSVSGGGVPYQYVWTDGSNDLGHTPTITVTPLVTTSYTLTVTDVGNNTLSSTPFTVTVNPLPALSVSPPGGSICNGVPSSITLVASGTSSTYAWSPSTGLSSTTSATVTASPAVSTTYVVTGTISATGCQNSVSVTVRRAQITNVASATPYNVCFGNSSQLKSLASDALSNYQVTPIAYNAATGGTPISLIPSFGFDLDEGYALVNIGFNFNFYGNTYSNVYVSANGHLQFGTPPFNVFGPDAPQPYAFDNNNIIGGVYEDLNATGNVEYFVTGTSPNQVFVARWTNIPFWSATGSNTFEIHLNEANNTVEVHVLQSLTAGLTQFAFLGVENATGTLAAFAPGRNYNGWTDITTPSAWRFTPPGGLTYNWTPSTFLNTTTAFDPVASLVTSTTTYTATAIDTASGCSVSDTVKLTVLPLPTVNITGPSVACDGLGTNLTFTFTGVAPFTYSYSDGLNTFGPFTTSSNPATISITPPGVPGETFTYSPTFISDARCTGSPVSLGSSVTMTVVGQSSLNGVTLTSNKPFNNSCTGDQVVLSLNGITSTTLGYQAQWKWYRGGCGTGSGGTLIASGVPSITVSPTATTTYYARAEGYCNTTACLSIQIVVSTAPPSGNPTFSYTPTVAYAGSQDSIVVVPVPGAIWYRWSTNGNTNLLFDGHPAPYQSTTNKVMVTFVGPSTQGQGIGNYHISMFAGNACGRTNQSNLQIRATVSQPAAINGPNVACVGQTRTYSIAPLVGAKTYAWSFTSGNGTIVGNGTTTVSVTFTSLPATLCVHGVTANNSAGPDQCLTITTNIAVPGPITGNAAPCQGTTQPYSIAPVVGAVSYQWSTTVAGALASGTTTTGSVSFPVGNFSGNVCVKANSGCGLSPASCLAVVNGAPAPVGTISGPTKGLCGVTSVNFQIPATGDTIYNWGVPAGATIVSGQGTNSILVNFSGSFVGGNITVQASNACGSVSGSLAVTGAPAAPSVSGATAVCAGDAENYIANSPGATGYTFSLDTTLGQIVPTGNPDEILVIWLANGGTISVTASNGCGTSSATSYVVGAGACRLAGDQAMADVLKASVYPNPSNGHMTLQYNSPQKASYMLKFTDLAGRIVYSESLSGVEGMNQHMLDMSTLAKGMYKLSIENEEGQSIVMKVVIE